MDCNCKIGRILAACVAGILSFQAMAQEQGDLYFVDGFHGGVYGHYPMKTYTDYMSDLIEKYPDWRMCLEIEPETWDTVKTRTPEAYARFCRIVRSDRVEFTNPSYAQPYLYNTSGESMIRQFAYGMKKINGHFPDAEFVTYAVEEPCFTSSLPQVLTQFGFKYAVIRCPNTCWGGYPSAHGNGLVNWVGPDGTSILAMPRYECEGLQEGSVWQTTSWGNTDEFVAACRKAGIVNPVGMCYQDAGWTYGPWIGYGDKVRNGSEYVTWREYFEEVSEGKSDDNWKFSQENVQPGLVWGSQVLQTIARQVRHTENNLIMTEKLGAMAGIEKGFSYDRAAMDEAWRTLMLAQHHDSWIVPYNGLNERGTWADNIALWTAASDEICDGLSLDAMASFGSLRSSGKYVKVFNTLGFARKEKVAVALPDGNTVTFDAEVPAFGYATYRLDRLPGRTDCATASVRKCTAGETVVENELYRLVFDASKGGAITSLVTRKDGREYVDARSRFHLNELRGFFYEEDRFRSSAETPAEIEVRDNGDVKTVIVRGTVADVPFEQTVVLRSGDRKIDCSLRIDWENNVGIGKFPQNDGFNANRRAFYDDRYKLSVLFPVDIKEPQISKDAPFDVCRSSLEDTFFETWDDLKNNVILHWVDMAGKDGDSFALLTDHTTSYSYGRNFPLGLTVQFSGNGLWGRNYTIDRPTEMKYAIVPHEGDWDESGIYEESLRWNEPLVCSVSSRTDIKTRSLISTEGTGYEISAAYMTDEGLLVRLFNASGSDKAGSVEFGFPVKAVSEVDLKGDRTGTPEISVAKGMTSMKVQMPRFGLKTYLLTL